MTRAEMQNRANARVSADRAEWDMIIVGGGATGVGIAIYASTGGDHTQLLEAGAFGKLAALSKVAEQFTLAELP